MHFLKQTATAAMVVTLAACGGSGGGGDPVEGVDFEISDGVLADFEVPTDAQIAELPTQIGDTVRTFIATNEAETLTSVLPAGELLYVGDWAMGQTEEEAGDATVGGIMTLNIDLDPGDYLVNGRLDVNYAFDGDTPLEIVRNPIEEFDVDIGGIVSDEGRIEAGFAGRFDVRLPDEEALETVNVGGIVRGSFAGENAGQALGELSGGFAYSDGTNDDFGGLFVLSQEPVQ